MNKNDNYIISNNITRILLKFLSVILCLLLLQLAFGSMILSKIYKINSELYLLNNSSKISNIEREFISNKISSCQKINENRYMINPLNFFIDKKKLEEHIKLKLESCLKKYVLDSNDNKEMNYREKQINLILNK